MGTNATYTTQDQKLIPPSPAIGNVMTPFSGRALFRPVYIQGASDVTSRSRALSSTEKTMDALSPNIKRCIEYLRGENKALYKSAIKEIEKAVMDLNMFTSHRGIILREISNPSILLRLQEDELDKICKLIKSATPTIASQASPQRFVLREDMPRQFRNAPSLTLRDLAFKEERIAILRNVIEFLGNIQRLTSEKQPVRQLTNSNYLELKSVIVDTIRVVENRLTDQEKRELREAFWKAMSPLLQGVSSKANIKNLQHHNDRDLISEVGRPGALLDIGFNWLGTQPEPSPVSDGKAGEGRRSRHPDIRLYTLQRNEEMSYSETFLKKLASHEPMRQARVIYRQLREAQGGQEEATSSLLSSQELPAKVGQLEEWRAQMTEEEYKQVTKFVDGEIAASKLEKAEMKEREQRAAKLNSPEILGLTDELVSQYPQYKKLGLKSWASSLASKVENEVKAIQKDMEIAPGAFAKAMRKIEGVEDEPVQAAVRIPDMPELEEAPPGYDDIAGLHSPHTASASEDWELIPSRDNVYELE